MYQPIENIRKTRRFLINHIKELSIEKLNKIPHGFNNNILWNVGHLVAALQSICYIKGSLTPSLAPHRFNKYMPGTKPDIFYDSNEEDEIKELLFSSLDSLQNDYDRQIFGAFIPWTNRYGVNLENIDDAIAYVFFHEGLHLGVIASIKKLVQK
jgi:hypothetical protein